MSIRDYSKLHLYLGLILASCLSFTLFAETFQLGDVAPRGAPDGQLNAADALILQKMVLGDITPTNNEVQLGDVAPIGIGDGLLTVGDLVVQQRAVLGLINLGTIDIISLPAPTLNAGASPTSDNPYLISGTANSNASVDIYVKGVLQQQVTSDGAGNFSIDVYLFDGINDIYVTQFDGVNFSPQSNSIQVQYNNTINRIQGGIISTDTVWTPGSSPQPYIITTTLTVASGVNFVIQPGTELKFEAGASLIVEGQLTATGTVLDQVVFTSINSLIKGGWGSIQVINGGYLTLDFVEIEYATNGIYFYNSNGSVSNSLIHDNNVGIQIEGNSSPVINQSNVITSNLYGFKFLAVGNDNPSPLISGNQVFNNDYYNVHASNFLNAPDVTVDVRGNYWGSVSIKAIHTSMYKHSFPLLGGSQGNIPLIDYGDFLDDIGGIAVGETLVGLITVSKVLTENTTYDLIGPIRIATGITLEVPEGVTIRSSDNKMYIVVDGSLVTVGLPSAPVVFTTTNETSSWIGVRVESGGFVDIDYTFIEDASIGVYFISGSSGTITNSWLVGNQKAIIIESLSDPVIDSNSIINNSTGIEIKSGANPTITNNDIYSNSFDDLLLRSFSESIVLDISGNWWGTDVIADIRANIGTSGTTVDPATIVLLDSISITQNKSPVVTNAYFSSSAYISPEASVGINDTVSFFIRLSSVGDWNIDIVNNSQQIVKSLSGVGDIFTTVVWDGRDEASNYVPEGTYNFVLSVGEFNRSYGMFIDNTVPTASFDAGLNGATLNTASVGLNGTAIDTNFLNYSVEYGEGVSPTSWTLIETSKVIPVSSDKLVDWLLTNADGYIPPIGGLTTLRLTVNDKAGNSVIQQAQVVLDVLGISDVSHAATTVYPAQNEEAVVSFTLHRAANVTMQISTEKDNIPIRAIQQVFGASGSYSMSWDGKDDSGDYVPDEAYRYTFLADDGVNQVSYLPSVRTTHDTYFGGSTMVNFNVEKNEFYRNTLFDNNFAARFSFCVESSPPAWGTQCGAAGAITILDGVPFGEGSFDIVWDGRDLDGNAINNRDYGFGVYTPQQLLVNSVVIKGTSPLVFGEGTAPNIEVKSNPYLVQHSFEGFSQIKYQLDQNSTVTSKLLPPGINDPSDLSAITLQSNQSVDADVLQTLTWMGYLSGDTNNILVSDEGLYTFTIEATSDVTGFTTLYRGALTLKQ